MRCSAILLLVAGAFGCSLVRDTSDLTEGSGGAGGSGASGGTAGSSSSPIALAEAQTAPWGIALDSSSVYFSLQTGQRTARVPKIGGALDDTFLPPTSAPRGIALDGSELFVANAPLDGVARHALDGSGLQVLSPAENQCRPHGIAVDASHVYWACTSFDSVRRVERSAISASSTEVSPATAPQFVALDQAHVYWSEAPFSAAGGNVRRRDLGLALPAEDFKTGLGRPSAIALDATHVYWVDEQDNHVQRAPKAGGLAVTLASASEPRGLALDATHVYFTNAGDGTIARVAKDAENAAAETLASGLSSPHQIAVDDQAIYWTENVENGRVMRLDK